MADHVEEEPRSFTGDLLDKLQDKLHGGSSSDSDHDDKIEPKVEPKAEPKVESKAEAAKAKIFRLFGRERPVHDVLGSGCTADVVLWRNKKVSGGLFGTVTAIWILFELIEYHLLTLLCHLLILSLAALFLWSNFSTFINKTPLRIPDVSIPEDVARDIALSLRFEINRALGELREIALGRDLKKFLGVIAGLWVLSKVGNCCNFLTLFYIVFVALTTIPAIYEKYEEKIDPLSEKAWIEIKKQYAVFDDKVLSKVLAKIPKGPLKDKKH